MKFITIVFLITNIMLIGACKKEDVTVFDCTGFSPTYNLDIKSILDTHCAISGCHTGSKPSKGIDLSTYIGSRDEGINGKLIGAIQHKKGFANMPRNASKLDDTTIKKISCWVQNGAPQ